MTSYWSHHGLCEIWPLTSTKTVVPCAQASPRCGSPHPPPPPPRIPPASTAVDSLLPLTRTFCPLHSSSKEHLLVLQLKQKPALSPPPALWDIWHLCFLRLIQAGLCLREQWFDHICPSRGMPMRAEQLPAFSHLGIPSAGTMISAQKF